jgi:hypothetical protein
MSTLKISEMLPAQSVAGSEKVPVIKDGSNVSVTIDEIRGVGGGVNSTIQTALDLKANLNSPTFTGNPESNATPVSGDHLTNKTYVDAEVAVVDAKLDVKQPAFYTVEVALPNNYTDPASFTSSTVVTTYDIYSRGSINTGNNNNFHTSTNSLLYTMNVKALSDTTITLHNWARDDNFYVYINDTLDSSYLGAIGSTGTPIDVQFTLSTGNNKIEIVKNDSGNGSNSFELLGNIISSTVEFISGK